MTSKIVAALMLMMALLALPAGWTVLAAQPGPDTSAALGRRQPPDNSREHQGDPAAPEISFIDSPTATCVRPDPHTDTCLISWSYLSVNATAPSYVVSMTVAIDGRLVANHQGFFQSSMVVPGELYGAGFEVSCGAPGTSGIPSLGRAHSYVLRARETGGLKAANYGTVLCPAGLERVYLPLTLR